MGLTDLIALFSHYGAVGIIVAVLISAVSVLYLQLIRNLKAANDRADRYETEVKQLNNDIQMYLALGVRAKQVMGEATTEMRAINDGTPMG